MNIKITYGDVVRHMNDYEMAEFFMLERIKIVHQVLDAAGDTERINLFKKLVNESQHQLFQEQLNWLQSEVKIPEE